ncbi:RNA polymerase sigma factor SigJ [Amycolatopsis nigrescens]|uniref:RNA polymerase sigma factor SigJ n=1 Tax=Amycolatopsis nigrescens TaxID=381445 RepID=UPI00036CB2CE|nr:RNA polymerase sigma factor SigJ [Amycolatopsis nigrescens]
MTDFEEHREALFGAAYRILGTRTDADDVLQDAWLRWRRVERSTVDDARAYLFRLTTNLALDRLRQVKARRETYLGPWLPEPLLDGPEADAGRADTLSMGLLVVLETLAPVERAVFVLHEAFGFSHAEIAAMLDRTERAVRQLAYRARRHLAGRTPRHRPAPGQHRELTRRFTAAAVGGDLAALLELLAPDAGFWADADGKRETPREPLYGQATVAKYFADVRPFWPSGLGFEVRGVNGGPGAVVTAHGRPFLVFALELTSGGDRVAAVRAVLNPAKLTGQVV